MILSYKKNKIKQKKKRLIWLCLPQYIDDYPGGLYQFFCLFAWEFFTALSLYKMNESLELMDDRTDLMVFEEMRDIINERQ